jgi:hypothetical protein
MSSSEIEGVVSAAHSLLAVLAMPFVPPAAIIVPEGEEAPPLAGVCLALLQHTAPAHCKHSAVG